MEEVEEAELSAGGRSAVYEDPFLLGRIRRRFVVGGALLVGERAGVEVRGLGQLAYKMGFANP